MTTEVTVVVLVLAFKKVVFVAMDDSVTNIVDPGCVVVRVATKLETVSMTVSVVVLANARGMTAPRRTSFSALPVGMHDSVVVDFLVVVLIEVLLTVIELFACTVLVLVVDGAIESVVLMVVEAAFWVFELVWKTVDPSLTVMEVGLGEEV